MEERVESFLRDTYSWLLQNVPFYAVIAYNYLSTTTGIIFDASRTTARAIIQANIPCSWVFLARNSYPLQLKEGDVDSSLVAYNPSTQSFSSRGPRTHLDVVTAELLDENSKVIHDLSSFFYAVSWNSAENAPSILELVLVYNLEQRLYLPMETVKKYALRIIDSDCTLHTLSLDSQQVLLPSRGRFAEAPALSDELKVE